MVRVRKRGRRDPGKRSPELCGSGQWPGQISTTKVSVNFFSVLGAAPAVGRTFTLEDQRRRTRVVVLSHELWRRRFNASRGVVGRTLEIAGRPFEVVGVMPEAQVARPGSGCRRRCLRTGR